MLRDRGDWVVRLAPLLRRIASARCGVPVESTSALSQRDIHGAIFDGILVSHAGYLHLTPEGRDFVEHMVAQTA